MQHSYDDCYCHSQPVPGRCHFCKENAKWEKSVLEVFSLLKKKRRNSGKPSQCLRPGLYFYALNLNSNFVDLEQGRIVFNRIRSSKNVLECCGGFEKNPNSDGYHIHMTIVSSSRLCLNDLRKKNWITNCKELKRTYWHGSGLLTTENDYMKWHCYTHKDGCNLGECTIPLPTDCKRKECTHRTGSAAVVEL